MKEISIACGIIVALCIVLLFGAFALGRAVRLLGWPNDILPLLAMACVIATGICLLAWRMNEADLRRERVTKEQLDKYRTP